MFCAISRKQDITRERQISVRCVFSTGVVPYAVISKRMINMHISYLVTLHDVFLYLSLKR